MIMKATCPNNPTMHNRFVTTAHVMQEWVVTQDGTFVKVVEDLEVVHGPDAGNIWTCVECGAEAKVEP